MNWFKLDEKGLPEKSGQYLIACDMENGELCYSVCDFYKKGDNICLLTPENKRPEKIRNGTCGDKLLWCVFEDSVKCPEDGFYEVFDGECIHVTNIMYWCEIEHPIGKKQEK